MISIEGLLEDEKSLSMGEMLTVKFRQPKPWVYLRCWHDFYILSIGTNPLGITSLFVHVGFGV
jgi:hypothetical protein